MWCAPLDTPIVFALGMGKSSKENVVLLLKSNHDPGISLLIYCELSRARASFPRRTLFLGQNGEKELVSLLLLTLNSGWKKIKVYWCEWWPTWEKTGSRKVNLSFSAYFVRIKAKEVAKRSFRYLNSQRCRKEAFSVFFPSKNVSCRLDPKQNLHEKHQSRRKLLINACKASYKSLPQLSIPMFFDIAAKKLNFSFIYNFAVPPTL